MDEAVVLLNMAPRIGSWVMGTRVGCCVFVSIPMFDWKDHPSVPT
jgi:hypothetical protein